MTIAKKACELVIFVDGDVIYLDKERFIVARILAQETYCASL